MRELTVGVIANMRHAVKGHRYLLQAIPDIVREEPAVKFLFIGEGPLRAEFEAYAGELGVSDHVIFAGSTRDIPKALSEIDIFCLPSLSEGFSNSILESMAAGKPVVATAVGGNPEVITDGETGMLVPPKDAKSLAERILALVRNKKLRFQISKAGSELVKKRFSVEKMASEYENFYRSLVSNGNGHGTADGIEPVRKRVCHLIWALEPGGAERQVVTIASQQKERGYDPFVVCLTRKGALADELESLGVPVTLIEKRPGADFSVVSKLAEFIKRNDIEILHTHVPTAGLWGRLAVLRSGRSVGVVVHEHSDYCVANKRFRFLNNLLTPFTDQYVTVSDHIARGMTVAGVSEEKITVIKNGIADLNRTDETLRREGRAELGLAKDAPLIGTVGRIESRKDHRTFVCAAALIKKSVPAAQFVIVGDGPERALVEEAVRKEGLEGSFHFLGVRSDVKKWLSAMDVFILSSVTEGISISLLEAMSCAKPCVVTNVGGNPEIIEDRINGRLVPKQDPAALALAVQGVLSDKAYAFALSESARATFKHRFSVEAMMDSVDMVYGVLKK